MTDRKSELEISSPVWEGIYGTWSEAMAHARGPGFLNQKWITRIVQQLEDYRSEMQTGAALPPRPSNLPALCSVLRPQSIVDFGGSSGWAWDYLTTTLPSNSIMTYQILEIPEIVDYFRTNSCHVPNVMYSTASEYSGTCDLLYSNSVLQYCENNKTFLEICARAKPRFILLDDLFAGDMLNFVSMQIYYEDRIPHRFLNFDDFRKEIEGAGYDLVLNQPYCAPIRGIATEKPMNNFPVTHRLRHSKTVCFQARTAIQ